MKITIVSFVMTAAFGLIACDNTKHNTLTEQEKAEGWELLFDGETLDGWRDYNGTVFTGLQHDKSTSGRRMEQL